MSLERRLRRRLSFLDLLSKEQVDKGKKQVGEDLLNSKKQFGEGRNEQARRKAQRKPPSPTRFEQRPLSSRGLNNSTVGDVARSSSKKGSRSKLSVATTAKEAVAGGDS